MITKKFQTTLRALLLAIALVIAGCGGGNSAVTDAVLGDSSPTDAAQTDAATSVTSTSDNAVNDGVEPGDVGSVDASTENQASHFDSDDLDYDESTWWLSRSTERRPTLIQQT